MASVQLRVYPNPYSALDADGHPSGAFPMDRMPGYWVGARLVADGPDPKIWQLVSGDAKAATRRFVFDDFDVVKLDLSNHYLYALRHNELFPADEDTARHAGIKFKPIAENLAAAKAQACARYRGNTGRAAACESEPLIACPVPPSPSPAPAPVPPPAHLSSTAPPASTAPGGE